tara:strand:+ start:4816 stop:5340 length:525 start_codon:yes stop_codon:yes gene_type:complete
MTPFQRHLKEALYIAEQASGGGEEYEEVPGNPPIRIYPDGSITVGIDTDGDGIIDSWIPEGEYDDLDIPDPEQELEDEREEWEEDRAKIISDLLLLQIRRGWIDVPSLINPGDPDPMDPANDDYYSDPDNPPYHDSRPYWQIEPDFEDSNPYPMPPAVLPPYQPLPGFEVWYGG